MRRLAPLLVLAALAAGCGSGKTAIGAPTTKASAKAGAVPVTPGEISHYPGRFAGHRVLVSGPMAQSYGAHAFTLGGRSQQPSTNAKRGVLVLAQSPPKVKLGQIVVVKGTVLLFRPAIVQRKVRYSIDAARLKRFEEYPTVIATSVRVSHAGPGS